MASAMKPLSEREIQTAVMQMWRSLGRPYTLVAAIPNARAAGQAGLTAGLPDLIVIGGNIGIGLLELKTTKGKLSEHQKTIADLCEHHMLHHKVAYGLDQALRILTDWGVLRAYRGGSSADPSLSHRQAAE
jgi:hypothetical protein